MKKNIVGKVITVILVVSTTIMVGMILGMYMLSNIDFDKYDKDYIVEVVK